jgi:allantoinase
VTELAAAPRSFVIVGDVVTPTAVILDGRMVVRDGRIVRVEPNRGDSDDAGHEPGPVIDARGRYIFPGVVDAHVHCYSELEEGFTHATAAAAAGGVTTIIEMPYDADQPVVDVARFEEKRRMLEAGAHVDVGLLGTIRKVDGVREIPDLAKAGVCGFKVSMFETHPTRFPRISASDLLEAFELIADAGLTVDVHAEDGEVIAAGLARMHAEGRSDPHAHGLSRPPISETASTALALELASVSGAQLHVCHASLPRVIDLVASYKEQGFPVSVETCPHYLLLCDDDLDRLGALGKINPPLRSAEDSEGLWERLAGGSIDIVASDHAPWLLAKKQAPVIFENSSGAPGVETLVPLFLHHGVTTGRLTIVEAARLLAETPARRFGLGGQKGTLAPGADADFIIWNPTLPTVLDGESMHSAARWTPYEGAVVRGRVEATYVRGRKVFGDGSVVGPPGWGTFVAPNRSGSQEPSPLSV